MNEPSPLTSLTCTLEHLYRMDDRIQQEDMRLMQEAIILLLRAEMSRQEKAPDLSDRG